MSDIFEAVVIARHSLSRFLGKAIYSAIKSLMRLLQSMKNRFRNDENVNGSGVEGQTLIDFSIKRSLRLRSD